MKKQTEMSPAKVAEGRRTGLVNLVVKSDFCFPRPSTRENRHSLRPPRGVTTLFRVGKTVCLLKRQRGYKAKQPPKE